MIENLGDVAKAAGIEVDTLKNAIESEESVSVELNNERVIYDNKEDFETYINNVKKEHATAAVEIAIKTVRNDLGLNFEGKTMDNLVNAIKDKTLEEAQVEPNKKVEELSKDLNTLRQQLAQKDEAFNDLQTKYQREGQERTINNQILDSFPKEGLTLSNEDLLTLFKSKYDVSMNEGSIQIKKGGEVLKDNLMNPMSLSDVVNDFTSPYKKPKEGGRGKGNEGHGEAKAGSIDAFIKEMDGKGIKANSSEFNQEMANRIQEGTLSL